MKLHVITDMMLQSRYDHIQLAHMLAEGGADVIQYRDKSSQSTARRVETAQAMLDAIKHTKARLIVNDRVDVAFASGAHGVHLGPDDLHPCDARSILGSDAIIGCTVNNLNMAVHARDWPIDYVGVGPVFATQSKINPAPVLGLDGLAQIVAMLSFPVVAIGGLNPINIASVMRAGAYGVAVLGAVVCAEDPGKATKNCDNVIND